MTTSKPLPPRPSLESLRKQAKKLAREIAAGDAGAITRARAQLPDVGVPLTQRNAQLVIAREYGYAGWQDLTADVSKRLERGLEWAVEQARRAIHDNDGERLKQLLAEHPALLSWTGDEGNGGLLSVATGSYGDSFDPFSEEHFTRPACAELLIDAGAVATPSIVTGILNSRARELLQLLLRKGLLVRTLDVLAALGDLDAVRAALDEDGHDPVAVNDAFVRACSFQHEPVASLLLDRSIALDPDFGTRVDGSVGRPAFIKYFIDNRPGHAREVGLWKAFVMEQVNRAVSSWSGHQTSVTTPAGDSDLTAFMAVLRREPWLLGETFVNFQDGLIGVAILNDRGGIIAALLDLDPALLRRRPPPPSDCGRYSS